MPFDTLPPAEGEPAAPSLLLSNVLGALSQALDLTEGQPAGHCQRACWIGVQIGRELGLDEAAIAELYYAVLLKDLGCSSNAARIADLYGTDDLWFKRDAKLLGDATGPALRFILQHAAPGAGLIERARTAFRVSRGAGAIVQDLIETRCQRGADIARSLRFSETVAGAIYHLDERWDGRGRPDGLSGLLIPMFSRIALLAQVVDVFRTADGPDAACLEVRRRTGTWFDPEVAAAFHAVASHAGFWSTLAGPHLEQALLALEPAQRRIDTDDLWLDDIAAAFAQVVDAKSPYTSGHSTRVADVTGRIAERLGIDPPTRRRLRRAALLHDVGKLGVSNAILDKPGKLDDTEWQSMRQHAVHSERILSRIPAFAELAEIGGSHHEKLDGTGYPRGLDAARIGFLTRIVSVADVCDALTADRPYRAAMAPERMLAIMDQDVGRAFDPNCLAALRDEMRGAGMASGTTTARP